MHRFHFLPGTQSSRVENEAYFPIRVVFDSAMGTNRFAGFYFGARNLLEFTIDQTSGRVKEFQIVTCDRYHIFEEECTIPSATNFGGISFTGPQHNDCDTFFVEVYSNCFRILLSFAAPAVQYAVGQVLFGLDEGGELVSLTITNITPDDITHTISELQSD